ncbi:pimeloyl-[acyl-carrier protein] methyl ester esterase [Betaproteobacteria bacterium]|nr:pimeloyl-[acyl-carrier protein] methyl ester esterase [Betaproteobacteria bacterium]GHU11655.1 pimeloyl-[acyl-carrier protein] methyl ester esterase [Betaproteobacteria bacterium]GHU45015.1 pimeloyl-[acyl-carrier protein] methyl ester esterase [Betaproteobacteria bacterium]
MSQKNIPNIFLPGWGLGCAPLNLALAGSDWQCRDLPGCGDDQTTEKIPENFAAAVAALLQSLPPVCRLGGWSLGGMLALACAQTAPERVKGLTLMGCTPSFIQREGWEWGRPPAELKAFMAKIRQDAAAILPRFIGSFCRGDTEPEAASWLLQHASPMSQAALDAGLGWLFEADLRAGLQGVSCPVVLVHGENDPLMPVAAAHWLEGHLPDATLRVIPGKAHAPFAPVVSAPSDGAAALRFLREFPPL